MKFSLELDPKTSPETVQSIRFVLMFSAIMFVLYLFISSLSSQFSNSHIEKERSKTKGDTEQRIAIIKAEKEK